MTTKDIFALILRALGAFSVFRALEGGAELAAVGCGFDMHLRNAPSGDAFVYLSYLIIGLVVIACAARVAGAIYKHPQPSVLDKDGVMPV